MKYGYWDWTIYSLENMVNNDLGTKYIKLLKDIKKKDGSKKVIEVMKASGYFISYNESRDKKIDSKTNLRVEVENSFYHQLDEKYQKEYRMLIKESEFMRKKRNEISEKIDKILDEYYVDCKALITTAIDRLHTVKDNADKIGNWQAYLGTQEYIVFCLGSLLKVLEYRGEKRKKKECLRKEKEQELWQYTLALREINEIIQSWMFGEVQVEVDEKGLSIIELFGRNTERIISAINFWDIKDNKDIVKQIECLDRGETYVSIQCYKETLESKIKEYFYTEDFQERYLEMKLYDWIRAYMYFKTIALENRGEIYISISSQKVKSDLRIEGFSSNEIDIILKQFRFSKEKKDLFDSFLIPDGEQIYFIPEIFDLIDPSRAMLSLFGDDESDEKKSQIANKGVAFENHISELVNEKKKINIQKNILANVGEEAYEVDIVFELDGILFFCECKTQCQHQDMRGYFRNKRELEKYIKKFKRNYSFFTQDEKGMQIIKTKMKINEIKKSVPVFISNVEYTDEKVDGIFITDEPRVYRYMKRIPANAYSINSTEIKVYRLFEEFYKGEIKAKQFIDYLKNKGKEIELEYRRIKLMENESLQQFGLFSARYLEVKTNNYLSSLI